MVEMCRVAGHRDQLTTLLLQLAEQVLNILLIHFQERYARLSIKLNDQMLDIMKLMDMWHLGEDQFPLVVLKDLLGFFFFHWTCLSS